jgi:hypothetical protein
MGLETRMYIVLRHLHLEGEDIPMCGEEVAMIDLRKLGYESPLALLFDKNIKKAVEEEKPPFALYARNPERQEEGIQILREWVAEDPRQSPYLNKLIGHLEDGQYWTDKYGQFLGVHNADEVIAALEESIKTDNYRRLKWALVLLKQIRDSLDEYDLARLCVVTYNY